MIALGVVAADLAVRPAVRGEGHRHPRGRHRDRLVGAWPPASSAPASTTCSPTGSASTATTATSSRSGRAASASPAGCWPASRRHLGGPPARAADGRGRQLPRRRRSPLAQAIGRWGNWFNQELFGRPDRPAVGARDRRRPPSGRATRRARRSTRRSSTSRCGTSPCAGCCCGSTAASTPRRGRLMGMYVVGYGIGRFWVEGLRIDTADHARRAALEPVGRARRDRRRARLPARHAGSRAPVAESNRCRRPGTGTRLTRSPGELELRPSALATTWGPTTDPSVAAGSVQ